MKLELGEIGKRYKFHWIFRNVNFQIKAGDVLTVKGPNGSGKSTLLKVISGFLSPSEGEVVYTKEDHRIDDFYKNISYAAPYVDLVNQMTLSEFLNFHQKFKAFKAGMSAPGVIDILELKTARDRRLIEFSSGMLQRVRLGVAILSQSDLCILDEPSTNLDQKGFEWYVDLLRNFRQNAAVVIASNEEKDFIDATQSINILDYKTT